MNGEFWWAVKSPTGTLDRSSARKVRADSMMDFVEHMIERGLMVDRVDWYGDRFYSRYWRQLRGHGYRMVRVTIKEVTYGQTGWTIPELTEMAGRSF